MNQMATNTLSILNHKWKNLYGKKFLFTSQFYVLTRREPQPSCLPPIPNKKKKQQETTMSSLWPGLCTWCPAGGRSRWGWWRGRPPCWTWGAGCSTAALRPAARRKVNFAVVFTWLASPPLKSEKTWSNKASDQGLRNSIHWPGLWLSQK